MNRKLRGLAIPQKLGPMKIWAYPDPTRNYVIGIDVAEGRLRDIDSKARRDAILAQSADRPDYSCAIVLEMDTAAHVATWHGYRTPTEFALSCTAIGYFYNTALLVPEKNGYGVSVIDTFQKQMYPNVYRKHRQVGRPEDDYIQPELGWTTSSVTKPLLIQRIHEILKEDPDFTLDGKLIDELRTMEYEPTRGEARSRGRNKDDRVMALGIALQARTEYLCGRSNPEPDPYQGLSYIDRMAWKSFRESTVGKKNGIDTDPVGSRLGLGPRYTGVRMVSDGHRDSVAEDLVREFRRRSRFH